MKRCILLAACAAGLWAQAPVPDGTVVVNVDGKDVTAGELRRIIANSPPIFLASYKANPQDAIRAYYVLQELSAKAEKLKFAEQSPWKDQIAIARMNILANAMVTNQLNAYAVPEEDARKYFEANASRFEQASVKIIQIGFKLDMKPKGTTDKALEDAARGVVEAAHSPDRSEADAKKLADDLSHQARGGVDFAKLAATYSDDEETKKNGGDFPVPISMSSTYIPEVLRRAALALQPGEVSDPVKVAVSYYIVRCEKKSAQSFKDVHSAILLELQQKHSDELVKGLQERFKPAIKDPEALIQIGNGK
jgi:parvulin-like peptidyl-prolyl isomerase